MKEKLYQIISDNFVAGFDLNEDKRATNTAPILKWMNGMTLKTIQFICNEKEWKLIEVK